MVMQMHCYCNLLQRRNSGFGKSRKGSDCHAGEIRVEPGQLGAWPAQPAEPRPARHRVRPRYAPCAMALPHAAPWVPAFWRMPRGLAATCRRWRRGVLPSAAAYIGLVKTTAHSRYQLPGPVQRPIGPPGTGWRPDQGRRVAANPIIILGHAHLRRSCLPHGRAITNQ